MILGRPTNLWLGAVTAVLNALVLVGLLVLDVMQLAGINGAAAALILLIANQAPTVKAGDTVKVETPAGQPNREVTVS